MKAVIYNEYQGPLTIERVKDPQPGPEAVVIEVKATGLCLSDWHGWMGHDTDIVLPHVPGHELAGTIVSKGELVNKWKIGDRVTVPFVGGCGKCDYCYSGNQQVCDNQFQPGFTAWGSFAEFVRIDYADINLVALPDYMSFEEAASLGCRFITAYRGVRHQGQLKKGQFIAIHGCGGVGLSAIQIAKGIGAKIIALDITDAKCEMAKELGADYAINTMKTNTVEAIKDYSKGGVDVSLDALGSATTCLNSINCLRKRGKHIQIGLMTGEEAHPAIPMSTVIANELEILGSHGMQAHAYTEMFQFIKEKEINLSSLITETIALEEVPFRLPLLFKEPSLGISVINSF